MADVYPKQPNTSKPTNRTQNVLEYHYDAEKHLADPKSSPPQQKDAFINRQINFTSAVIVRNS